MRLHNQKEGENIVYLLRTTGLVLKNCPANAGDVRDTGSIPGSGRSPGGGNGNHSSNLAWRIPWAEEPGGLQSMGRKELDTTEQLTLYS